MAVGLGLTEGVRTEEPGRGSVCRARTCDTCGRDRAALSPRGQCRLPPELLRVQKGLRWGAGQRGRWSWCWHHLLPATHRELLP